MIICYALSRFVEHTFYVMGREKGEKLQHYTRELLVKSTKEPRSTERCRGCLLQRIDVTTNHHNIIQQ